MDEASVTQRVDTQIDCLPDDILVEVLSRMRLKEAGRTSVLSRRWRYLWRSSLSLCFGPMDDDDYYYDDFAMYDDPRTAAASENYRAWVNRVLELHQAPQLDKFVVHFYDLESDVRIDEFERWLDFAMLKEVKELEFSVACKGLCLCKFPNTEKYVFGSLRSLRLEFVDVKDEVVHNILASCPYLKVLAIHSSYCTRNLQVIDPLPNLKHLEITSCKEIQRLEVSVTSLVSFRYDGRQDRLLLKNIPNLSEVSLGGGYASSFVYEGNRHASYSAPLVKIAFTFTPQVYQRANRLALPQLDSLKRLELYMHPQVGESLLFFTLLTKAAPLLGQFVIMLDYKVYPQEFKRSGLNRAYSSPPEVCAAELTAFHHENLKLVVMIGYIGCPSEEKFLQQLCKMAPSLEKVVVDPFDFHINEESVPYHKLIVKETGASTRAEAMERAKNLKFTPPLGACGDVIMSSTEEKVIWRFETHRKTSNEPAQSTDLKHLIRTGG